MRKLNYVSILLAVITVLGLTSCEENEDFQNSESKLCNQLWVEGYNIDSGDHCTHQLEFAYNGSGREVFIYQRYLTVTYKHLIKRKPLVLHGIGKTITEKGWS